MSRYAAGQLVFAVVVTVVGTVKAVQIVVDWVADNTVHQAGLR